MCSGSGSLKFFHAVLEVGAPWMHVMCVLWWKSPFTEPIACPEAGGPLLPRIVYLRTTRCGGVWPHLKRS